ncbi:MAG TPA: alpha/beta fold hydrolase [Nostocaceae cyanobacterium]|nr:alpha/beta fold hydrolase [Nostocaceae cyanobacterium]
MLKHLSQLAKTSLACFTPLLGASALIMQPSLTQAATAATVCYDTYLPVALAAGESPDYQVYGQLCQDSTIKTSTVQVLLPGNLYNHTYWDFPYQPNQYSYVQSLTQAGYATFNIDRIGTGKSSRPPADLVNVESNGYVLNQVNQALRNNGVNGVKFSKIINVGHSFGSITAIDAASKYGGVDGVILSGFLHNINPDYFPKALPFAFPAALDPLFSGANIPDGYLTTLPGAQATLFYNQSNADPQVIAIDQANKDTLTVGELNTNGPAILSDISKQINVPVLLAIGSEDLPFCTGDICDNADNVKAFESPFFSPQAQLETYVLPDAGHSINLHLNAPLWFDAARDWSDRYVGKQTQPVPEPVLGLWGLTAIGFAGLTSWKKKLKKSINQ